MSDYRNPNDPSWRDSPYNFNARSGNVASGWIAGGVFLVIVIGLAFGVGHMPNHGNNSPNNTTANNTSMPATQPAPSGPAGRTYSPTPMSPMESPEQNPAPANPGRAEP
jgi:hypothetical protein